MTDDEARALDELRAGEFDVIDDRTPIAGLFASTAPDDDPARAATDAYVADMGARHAAATAPDPTPDVPMPDNVVPFSPTDEARTCVPHGRRDCDVCAEVADAPTLEDADDQRQAEHDAATQAWIDAKPPDRATPAPVDADTAQAAADAVEQARAPHRDDALTAAMTPQLGLDLGVVHDKAPAVKLTDRFVIPPFSTLDSRQDYWKQRKRAWLGLGIQSELGREGTLTYQTDTVLDPDFYRKKEEAEAAVGHPLTLDEFRRDHYRGLDAPPTSIQNTGTSIFDPVLCEVAYRWFSPHGGVVLDPFAGGSVRGVVASILGRRYYGVELREEQVRANRGNAAEVVGPDSPYDFGGDTPMPTWLDGDATLIRSYGEHLAGIAPGGRVLPWADLIFTCPPYADLEVYSDDPRDLSTAPYPSFRAMLGTAMAQSVELLRDDRFAVWVVGEARDRHGYSYGIIADTVRAALDAGLRLYNEAILETAIASAAMRATKQVLTSRKLVRVHQHVLVFVKGDARTAALTCGDPLLGGAA